MSVFQTSLTIATERQGLMLITREVEQALSGISHEQWKATGGLVTLFLQHTSASLLIQENSDPQARLDLEEFLNRLVPENQSWHRHLDEGLDDTPSHMKCAVTPTTLTIPFANGKMLLGTWQGIYLWEHRRSSHRRNIILTLMT